MFISFLTIIIVHKVSHLSSDDPDATDDMNDNHEHDHEEEETLKTETNLQELVQVRQDLCSIFYNLQDSEQLEQFDQSIETIEFRQSEKIIDLVLILSHERFYRENRNEINDEPRFDVVSRNLTPIFHNHVL